MRLLQFWFDEKQNGPEKSGPFVIIAGTSA